MLKDELFSGAWTPKEAADIVDTLSDLAKVPIAGPGMGQAFGAGGGIGLGALAGSITGDPMMGMYIAGASYAISQAMTTTAGRTLVRQLSRTGNIGTSEGMTAIGALINSQARPAIQQMLQPGKQITPISSGEK